MDFLQSSPGGGTSLWQTLGEKVSSIFNPSSVLEDVVSAQDNVPVQKGMPSANRPASVDPKVKSEHKCTCGMHLESAEESVQGTSTTKTPAGKK